jgi:hypothetical protein
LMSSDAADRDEVRPDRLHVPLASACHCIRRDRKV